jgi:hypothetical protein
MLPTDVFSDLKLGDFSVANCDATKFEYCNAFHDNGWVVWKIAAAATLAINTELNAFIELDFVPVSSPTRTTTVFYSYVWKD